jgi:hypothetical protein
MAKYKQYDYKQLVILPISLEDQLAPGTLEFAIHTLVETRVDLGAADKAAIQRVEVPPCQLPVSGM